MALGRICPGCRRIVTGPCPCRPGGKRTTPRRALNQKVWASADHKHQRIRILRRDDYTCVDCGWRDETETGLGLIADHRHGIDEIRVYADDELDTRCAHCSGRKDGKRANR